MKKLFLALAIFGFIAFGVAGIQDIQASTYSIEMVKFDKDPSKAGDKKVKETKAGIEMKGDCAKAPKDGCCASATGNKSDCCAKSKENCSKECPDKK
jgi:hypothetical protein